MNTLSPQPASPDAPGKRVHWIARINHRSRTFGFALLLVIMGLHMAQHNRSWALWLALVLQFGVYPQVAFWRARRAADPLHTEVRHMWLDALSLGGWIAVLHFPLWISFAAATGAMQNLTFYRGARGWLEAVGLLLLGCGLAGWVTGWAVQPQTDDVVTALSIIALSLYLFSIALDSQRRSVRLREVRQELRAKEHALQQQLAEIRSLQAELRDQARHDALTGLFNRRHLNELMTHELARCARNGEPLSLLMIDIDHFKRINDAHGHQVGDEVLRETARLLTERARASDMLFRYGGEEFLLVLLPADAIVAKEVAEELRQRYAVSPLTPGDPPITATLSIGVATFADHGVTVDSLIEAADQALYRAKRAGRNRVEIA